MQIGWVRRNPAFSCDAGPLRTTVVRQRVGYGSELIGTKLVSPWVLSDDPAVDAFVSGLSPLTRGGGHTEWFSRHVARARGLCGCCK